jgi:serine/threonine-protein kinase RsbW
MTTDTLHLSLRSSFEEIERAVEESEGFFGARYSDPDFVYNLVLLTSEAVTNAIEHGNHEDARRTVNVWLEVADSEAVITVEDEGEGFDPNSVQDPLAPEHIFDEGGRGVFLMESLADEVTWSNRGRRVTLRLRQTGARTS